MNGMQPSMQNAHAAPWLSHGCTHLVLGELELEKKSKKASAFWIVQCPLLMDVGGRFAHR